MEVSQCCAAPIIYSDICSTYLEHTRIMYDECIECGNTETGYGMEGELCKECDEEQKKDQYADSE